MIEPHSYQDRLLSELLSAAFADLEPEAREQLRRHLRFIEVAAGQTLMEQGEPGDSLYLSVSGRLRAYVHQDDGGQRMVREMGRGQVIGEMSLYTDEPRSATVVAIRDSVLARLDKPEFEQLLRASPALGAGLTRQIMQRLRTEHAPARYAAPVVLALLPVTAGVHAGDFAAKLLAELGRFGRVRCLDAAAIEAEVQGIVGAEERSRHLAVRLDEIEAENDLLLLLADESPTEWTQRCCRHADEVLLIAQASAPVQLHASETRCLVNRPPRAEAAEVLVLLHPADAPAPSGTAAWLDRRPVADHVHIRPELPRDMARLARLITRRAVGLVLAGGGARGFSHLGLLRALEEQGIEVDCVGGTSMGSVMAAMAAADRPVDEVMAVARGAFKVNPTGDLNWLPLISLIRGERMRGVLRRAVRRLAGGDVGIEDLWKNYFCIATNYSQAREDVLTRGDLQAAVRASTAIPGALPPVVRDGDLLCDGGTFNNFPVDVMRNRRGVGLVIGADLSFRKPRRIEFDEVPGPWTLLRDRLRPRKARRYKLPSLGAYLLNVTILYSQSRQAQARKGCDVYLNPPMDRVGLLQWDRFESITQQGYDHGREVLAGEAVQQRLRQVLGSTTR